ncbi:UNVERIFIED_CONTAM: hypothetical protein Sangu_1882600 [Sesamum angustifolium]|uniref:Uncharacterized protein n=1 Tax=Sesamum angustifolium TaxID=2727405 RepID=A0AAW2LV71_9LAMI
MQMTNSKTTTTPSLAGEKFTLKTRCSLADPGIYKRFVELQQHWDGAMHLLRYLKEHGVKRQD